MNKIQFIDFLAFYKIKGDTTLCAHIIEKFKNGTIKTEKLAGNQNLFAFRVNREQRVICTMAHYEAQTGLIVLELLPHHEYASSKYLNGTAHFDPVAAYKSLEIVAKCQDEVRDDGLPILPMLGSIRLQDTVILLNPQQLAILDRDEEKSIIIVTGSAGTGKTLIAELLLKQQRHTDYKVLYVTASEELVAKVRGDFQEEELCAAAIKSLQELCSHLIADKSVQGEIDFINWVKNQNIFKDYIKDQSLKDSMEETARILYEDIRKVQDSRGKNLDELGRKSLHHDDEIVKLLFDKYIKQLINSNGIDLSLTDYPEGNQPLYDCMVVDEAQDFGKCQLTYIHSFLKENGHTYFFIDPHQSVFHDFNLIDRYIQTLTHFPEQDILRYQLMAGYRNPCRVTEFANQMIKLKRHLVGGRLNQEELTIQSVPDSSDGYLGWIERVNEGSSSQDQTILDSLRQQSEQSIEIAFVVAEISAIKQGKQLFPKGIFFTPETIKGLEFSTIVLLDFLTKKYSQLPAEPLATFAAYAKDTPDKVYFPKSTEQAHLNRFFNRLFVGVTRSMERVYFIHTKPDSVTQQFKKIVEGVMKDGTSVQNAPLPASTLEEISQFITEHADRLTLPLLVEYGHRACDRVKEGVKESDFTSFSAIKKVLSGRSASSSDRQQQKEIAQLVKRIDKEEKRSIALRHPIDSLANHSLTAALPHDKMRSIEDLRVIDLNKLTAQELEQVINGKSVLCNLLILRKQDLQEWFKNEPGKFGAFVKKITLQALNASDGEGVSALYCLTYCKSLLEMLNYMVKDTIFIKKITLSGLNRPGPKSWSPFLLIAINEDETVLNRLKKNKKLDLVMQEIAETFSGKTSLRLLVSKKHFSNFKQLSALSIAIANDYVTMVKYLVDNGAKVQEADHNGDTALHLAADTGRLSVVKYLTEYLKKQNEAIEVVNHGGATALHGAVHSGQFLVVEYLVKMGFSATKGNDKGATALHVAAAQGHLKIVKYLLGLRRVEIDQPTKDGGTPLHAAAQNGHLPVVELLISKGAQIHALANERETPLCLAAMKGHLEVVKALMKYGAMDEIVKQTTDKGYATALDYAIQHNHLPVIQYLVEQIKTIAVPDQEFSIYFYKAAKCGHLEVVQWLLKEANVVLSKRLNNAQFIEEVLEHMQLNQDIVNYLKQMSSESSQEVQLTQMISGVEDSQLPSRQPSSAVGERAHSDTVASNSPLLKLDF